MPTWLNIMRPTNDFIAGISVLLGAVLAKMDYLSANALLGAFSFALFAAAGNVQNDLIDYQTDLINRPNRPLPSGKMTRQNALILSVLLYIFAFSCLIFLPFYSVLILSFTGILLFFYNFRLKASPFFGNFSVAILCSLPILFPLSYSDVQVPINWIAATFAFVFTFIREIVKDIEDYKGDLATGIQTGAALISPQKLSFFLQTVLWLSIPLVLSPIWFEISNQWYLVVVCLFVLPFLLLSIRFLQKHEWHGVQIQLKMVMIGGLVSLWLGSF